MNSSLTINTEKKFEKALERLESGKRNVVISAPTKFLQSVPKRTGKLQHCFLDADLRGGHDFLAALAKTAKTTDFPEGIDVTKFKPGQMVMFVNTDMDKIKLYAANGVIAYKKLEKGQRFDMRVLQYIAEAFNASGRIDYDTALSNFINEAFARRHPRLAKQFAAIDQ